MYLSYSLNLSPRKRRAVSQAIENDPGFLVKPGMTQGEGTKAQRGEGLKGRMDSWSSPEGHKGKAQRHKGTEADWIPGLGQE